MDRTSSSDEREALDVGGERTADSGSTDFEEPRIGGRWQLPVQGEWVQEEETGSDEEIEEFAIRHVPRTILGMLHLHDHVQQQEEARLRDFPRLPVPIHPLKGDLRLEADMCTSDKGVAKELQQLKLGCADIAKREGLRGIGGACVHSSMDIDSDSADGKFSDVASTSKGTGRHVGFLKQFIRKSLKCPFSQGSRIQRIETPKESTGLWGNVHNLLCARELGMCQGSGFCHSQQCNVLCGRRIPSHPTGLVEELSSRAYVGRFSDDGSLFVAAFQDSCIRIYDVHHGWRIRKIVNARTLNWTITDTALSPDGRLLLYSSITPIVHLVNVGSFADGIESMANVTEIHDSLPFVEARGARRHMAAVGIWSLAWSQNGREIVAGTNDNHHNICVFDLEERRTTTSVQGHTDDVNAVAFLDNTANVFVSGSDDELIKVWDRRTLGARKKAAGVLVGHTEGITHIDCKGDGRCLISNSKDQTIKLWDVRKLVCEDMLSKKRAPRLPHFHWDYRWNQYPGEGFAIKHPYDSSVMTYRGHSVLKTLIRAYFSPEFTTAQRYIYTGSRTGSVHVYDVVSGEEVERLQHHVAPVRDCSWHPSEQLLVSVSWDGCVVKWEPRESCQESRALDLRRPSGDKLDYDM